MPKGRKKNSNNSAKNKKNKNKNRTARRQKCSGKGKNKQLWENHWNLFQSELKALGLFIRDIVGDGNCLFRAIADQMEGDESKHQIYRAICCNYLMENEEYFSPFVLDDQTYESYVDGMRKNGIWGGNLELQSLSKALEVNFILHMQGRDPMVIRNQHYNIKNPRFMHLAYHVVKDMGEHYSSVRLLGDEKQEAALPIELEMFKDLHLVEADEAAFLLDEGSDFEGGRSDSEGDEQLMEIIEKSKVEKQIQINKPAPASIQRPLNPKQLDRACWVSHFEAFQEYCKKLKIFSKDNGNDEHALYEVLADQIFGVQDAKDDLIDLHINYVENNKAYVSELLIQGLDYETYLKKIKSRKHFGSFLELQILSKSLQINLIIFEKAKKPYRVINKHENPDRPFIMIGYHAFEGLGENFTSLRRLENLKLDGPQDEIPFAKGMDMKISEFEGENWIKEKNLKELESRKLKEDIKESIRSYTEEYYNYNTYHDYQQEEEKKMNEDDLVEESIRLQIAELEIREKEEKISRLNDYPKDKNCFCGKKKKYKDCCYEQDLKATAPPQQENGQAQKKKPILI